MKKEDKELHNREVLAIASYCSFVNPESLIVGQQIQILNFKERCSDFIKYPIKDIKEVN